MVKLRGTLGESFDNKASPEAEIVGVKVCELKEGKGIWRYPDVPGSFTPGALRLIKVKPLLSEHSSKIVLYEFPDLVLGDIGTKYPLLDPEPRNLGHVCGIGPAILDSPARPGVPKYTAVSHVWQPSPAIADRPNIRPLEVLLEDDKTHEISWHGLRQVAIAVKHLKCEYIWLDFVSLNQVSRDDKRKQIQNMANIYAHCRSTIVMLGGIRAAQRLEDQSFWHTRAWTLQEAIESVRRGLIARRFALVEWPHGKSYQVWRDDFFPLDDGIALFNIRELLDLQGRDMPTAPILRRRKYIQDETGEMVMMPVNSFGHDKTVITALFRLFFHPTETGSRGTDLDSSIWRSLWVRTSSHEHDLLYSSMKLFSRPISLKVDYSLPFEDLLIEFIGNLHTTPAAPEWLKISHRIPVYPWSGLLPQRPDYVNHQVPTYGGTAPHKFLCTEGCCENIDIFMEVTGASKEKGHSLCAKFMKLVRVTKTWVLPAYKYKHWQHVRKIEFSYTPDEENKDPTITNVENWEFTVDADATVKETDIYTDFEDDKTTLNIFDGTGVGRMVMPQHNKHEWWSRSKTIGADLTPLERHTSVRSNARNITALCWLDGRFGPYMSIVGIFNEHHQNPIVYFFDRDESNVVRRVGTGKLLLPELDRVSTDIPWAHLRVGGEGDSMESSFTECKCKNKKNFPVIKENHKKWWSSWAHIAQQDQNEEDPVEDDEWEDEGEWDDDEEAYDYDEDED